VDFSLSVDGMIGEIEVYGITEKMKSYALEKLSTADELCLDYPVSVLPPSKFFMPPRESLITFSLISDTEVHHSLKAKPSVIIGIHPFDLHAVKLSDAVFLGKHIDVNYRARRSATAIIGIDCLNPWPFSFASSMGTTTPPDIFDLWLTDLGDDYLIEVGSSKGDDLIRNFFNAREASDTDIQQREKLRENALGKYQLHLDMPFQKIPQILEASWESPMWKELGQKCFSCGSCTMVCPTCVCFNVRDKIDLKLTEGERRRYWDSCMFQDFAIVASGENFRPTGTDRLRHRLYRKGKYMLDRWGELGCVGCGRCINACLVDIASPVAAYNRLAGEVGQ